MSKEERSHEADIKLQRERADSSVRYRHTIGTIDCRVHAQLMVITRDCPATQQDPKRPPEAGPMTGQSSDAYGQDNRKAHTNRRGPATALHVKSRGHSRPTAGNTRARPSSHNIVEQGAVRTAIRQAPNRGYRVRSGSHRLSLTPAAAVPRLVIQLRIQRTGDFKIAPNRPDTRIKNPYPTAALAVAAITGKGCDGDELLLSGRPCRILPSTIGKHNGIIAPGRKAR